MSESALASKREVKACPFCGEEIMAVAIKCKHCGERLDATGKSPEGALVHSNGTRRPHWLRRYALSAVLTLILLLGVGAGMNVLPETAFWVRLHGGAENVMWHRAWQNKRMEKDRDRVREIYESIREANSADPVWTYLAIRSLPAGVEQTEAFDKAHQEYPEDPWLAWSSASVNKSLSDQMAALKLFGSLPPPEVLASVVSACSAAADWDCVNSLESTYRSQLQGQPEAAGAVARAKLRAGMIDEAKAWAENSDEKRKNEIRQIVNGIRALGLRTDLVGKRGEELPCCMLAITDFEIQEESGVYNLRLWTENTQLSRGKRSVWAGNYKLKMKSGRFIEANGTYSRETPPNVTVFINPSFTIPRGEQPMALLFETNYESRDSGERIYLSIPIGAE